MDSERFLMVLMIQSSFQMLGFCCNCGKFIIVAGGTSLDVLIQFRLDPELYLSKNIDNLCWGIVSECAYIYVLLLGILQAEVSGVEGKVPQQHRKK